MKKKLVQHQIVVLALFAFAAWVSMSGSAHAESDKPNIVVIWGDALAGKAPNPRHEFFYFNDDGSLVCLRYDQWKIVFAEQRADVPLGNHFSFG